ncbi:MAG: hypothetical protein ACM339_01350 [Ignavibacteria bacterium]
MNSIKIFILIFVLFFSVRAQEINTGDCKPELSVETDINQALIFINGNIAGRGELDSAVEKGKYVIIVKENTDEWNAKVYIDTLLAYECREYSLNYKFNSRIYLKTEPQDVYVYRSDSLFGHTPIFINRSDFIGNSFELRKPGYDNKVISLGDIENSSIVKLNYSGKEYGESFYEKDIFKVLVGSIIILGGTTAYFKLKADEEFDNYQSNGSLRSLYNTRRYDLISGISFAALQINFGVLIYYFFID